MHEVIEMTTNNLKSVAAQISLLLSGQTVKAESFQNGTPTRTSTVQLPNSPIDTYFTDTFPYQGWFNIGMHSVTCYPEGSPNNPTVTITDRGVEATSTHPEGVPLKWVFTIL